MKDGAECSCLSQPIDKKGSKSLVIFCTVILKYIRPSETVGVVKSTMFFSLKYL